MHAQMARDVYSEARSWAGSFIGLVESGIGSSSCSVGRIALYFRGVLVIWKVVVESKMLDEGPLLRDARQAAL